MIHLFFFFFNHTAEKQMHGGCMYLAPPTHNNSEWQCRAKMNSGTEREETDKDEEIEPKKGHTTLLTWK